MPYLRRVLFSKKLLQLSAITGLERIKNRAAVQVLAEGLHIEVGDTALIARGALVRMREEAGDTEIRQEIDRILNER